MLAQDHECILCGKRFEAKAEAFLCKNCQEDEKPTNVSIRPENQTKEIACPKCTFKNPEDLLQCQMCNFVFEQKLDLLIPRKFQKKQSMLVCKNCKFENHIANEYCLSCQQELFQHPKKTCDICDLSVKEKNYEKHYQACLLSKSMLQQEEDLQKLERQQDHFIPDEQDYGQYQEIKPAYRPLEFKPIFKPAPKKPPKKRYMPGSMPMPGGLFGGMGASTQNLDFKDYIDVSTTKSCYYCYEKIQKKQFYSHVSKCQKKNQFEKALLPAQSRMTPIQVHAIRFMHNKSEKQHQSVRNALLGRMHKLGYSNEDLDNLQYYIENYAPIIIQIHISRHMEFFVKDTHYRSQFETNKSSGSLSHASRTSWEDRMFSKQYSNAKAFQRVKYGVINFTNDPAGVHCAKGYGPSYFLLKSHVRNRCTFTDMDSSSPNSSIATLKFSFKIISKMNDNELKAAFQASKALQMPSNVTMTYKEIQIHGPIEFSKDIERVYVNKVEINGNKKLLDMVYEFSQKNKVQHDFI